MRTIWAALAITFVTAAWIPFCWAEAENGMVVPLRLAIDLGDGSHVIGVPSTSAVSVQTPYAKMDIPLKQIAMIRIEADHETAAFELVNGDRLKGVFDLGPLKLTTVFGEVQLSVAHLARIAIIPGHATGGGGPYLHYTFDDDEDRVARDAGEGGHDGRVNDTVRYEAGIEGMAIRTSSKNSYVMCADRELSFTGWQQLTVAGWFKMNRYATYGHLVSRAKDEAGGGAFGLTVGGQYGGKPYDGGFSVRLGDGAGAGLRVKRFAELNTWYHVAGVYDGQTVKYYVNGDLLASKDVPDEHRNRPLAENTDVDLMIGKNAGHRSWADTHIDGLIDDVRIYRRALAPGEIRALATP